MPYFWHTPLAGIPLLVANAFFVAAEFALIKARGVRIDGMVAERHFGARLARRLSGNMESDLAACQLGITMASLGLGWVGEPAVEALVSPLLDWIAVPDELDANTISGLLLKRLSRMPEVGDRIREDGFEIEVLEMNEHHVAAVTIQAAEPEESNHTSRR